MRGIRIYRNVISSVLLQIILAIFGLAIPRMILKIYGSEINGLINAISQFITYAALIEFGIGDASVALLYKPLAEDNSFAISDILSGTRKLYFRSAIIYSILLMGLAFSYPFLYKNSLSYWFIFDLVVFIGAVNAVDYFFLGKFKVLLMADQKYYIINFTRAIATFLLLGVSIVMLSLKFNVVWIKAVALLMHIGEALVLSTYVKLNYKNVDYYSLNSQKISQRWNALIHQICGTIIYSTDLVVLTLCLPNHDLLEISVYSVYAMVFSLFNNFTSTIMRSFYASFGDMLARNEEDNVKNSYLKFEFIYYIFIFFVCACFASLIMPFVACYTRGLYDVQYVRIEVAVLFALTGLSAQVKDTACIVANAAGKFKETQRFSIEEAIMNIVISLLLVRPMGIVGVLIGTFIAHVWMDIRYIMYVENNLILGIGNITIKRIIRNLFIVIILSVPEIILVPIKDNWICWLLTAVIVASINISIILLINGIMEKNMMKNLIKDFQHRLNKKIEKKG